MAALAAVVPCFFRSTIGNDVEDRSCLTSMYLIPGVAGLVFLNSVWLPDEAETEAFACETGTSALVAGAVTSLS